MTGKKSTDLSPVATGQFLVYEAEDGRIKIDVRLENEMVWLTQRLMAELFQKDVRTINEHIQNVYEERELEPEATIRKFRRVQKEGTRDVARMVDFFNLDMMRRAGKNQISKTIRPTKRLFPPSSALSEKIGT
ncbi:MAG: hypothetical protein Q8R88_05055 [Desulfoprunum sp.]|nr:hypothetical protein [Desulfoprunum sp.]